MAEKTAEKKEKNKLFFITYVCIYHCMILQFAAICNENTIVIYCKLQWKCNAVHCNLLQFAIEACWNLSEITMMIIATRCKFQWTFQPPNVINNGFHCNFMQLTITHMDLIIVCSIRSLLFSSNVGDRVTTSCNLLCVCYRFLYHIDIIIGVGVLRHRPR